MTSSRSRSRLGWLGLSASLVAVLAMARPVQADVKLPSIFGSHMVLQQKQADKVWGWAAPGEKVTVTIADQTKTATADDKGAWSVKLDPLNAGGPLTLTIKGNNTITFDDVLVGEVWICSGQSNMQWSVSSSTDPDLESLAANFPQIRLISVPLRGTGDPQDDFNGSWTACTPETVKGFSAVGYFFGRQLHQTLNVPVGLINNAWGGSACEAWIRRDLLEKDPQFAPLIDRWKGIEADFEREAANYPKALAEWKEAAAKAKADGKDAPPAPKLPNSGALNGNARPGNIYNGMVKPLIGFNVKGDIWYQGESNASRAYQYRELFPLMIKSWREEWGIGDFSFYWVQLADFLAEKANPEPSAWAELREAQTMTLKRLPNTGEAVIIDIGEGKDIHPKNKQDVAKRLARWALAKDYGINIPAQSPTYSSARVKDGKITLKIEHTGGGFRMFDVAEPIGFSIAGDDKKFVWATAKVTGPDTIEVSADSVKNPVAVRYAWADNPKCNVYGNTGLPLTPFRTDDWPGVTAEAK